MPPDLKNKKVLITGATSGIGKIAALELAKMGAHVILVGRDPQKSEQTAREIRAASHNERVDTLLADLSEMAEVRRLAAEYRRRYDRLHVLVNNAGAWYTKRQLTREGLELTFALNHLSYFLLTNLLLDLLVESAPARVINVSSGAHFGAKLDLRDLNYEKGYISWVAYARSKLMNIYFTYELARRLEGSRVTANCLHPGFVATNFGKNNGGLMRPVMALAHLGAITPEQGAETIVHLASSPQVEGLSGDYYYQKRAVRSSGVSYDQEIASQLWQASLELAGLKENQPAAD